MMGIIRPQIAAMHVRVPGLLRENDVFETFFRNGFPPFSMPHVAPRELSRFIYLEKKKYELFSQFAASFFLHGSERAYMPLFTF